jgi:serine/threonine-protein kinase
MTGDPTRLYRPPDPTVNYDTHLDAGLAVAFGPDATTGRWSCPPVLRDDASDLAPIVQPASAEMPRRDPDRFQLHGEIARGGMGVILKGHDPGLGRDLAFKVLKRELTGRRSAEQRFVEEAQIGGQLQHPGIVPVYELDRFDDGRPYFTMKLVNGRTLSELLAARADPTDGRVTLLGHFLKVCETIAYAHNRGVIHRDLKPANVMVGHFGEVLVMDWGLAKVLPRGEVADRDKEPTRAEPPPDGAPVEAPTAIHTVRTRSGSETLAGSVLGTPTFMSPEQAGGEIDKLDERADVFGLGAILCVILTGEPPFVGPDSEAVRLMAIRGQLDGAYARLEGSDDPELVRLCTRCLAPAREDRPRHAGEVRATLAAYLGAVEERLRRAEVEREAAVIKSVEERKRRRVQAALGLTAAAAAGLVAFGLWWHDRQATATRQERQAARDTARLQAATTLDRAETALRQDRPAEADTALDRAADFLPAAKAADLEERHQGLRADRATVAELDQVWARSNAILDEQAPGPSRSKGLWFDDEAARKGYPAALAAHGLSITAETAGDVADRIRRSPIRDRLIAALDDWLPVAVADDRPRLYDVLARVDPDPARSEVRRAHVEPDRLPTLFTKPPPPEALRVAARAATHPTVDSNQALAVLRAAALRDPADFRTQCAAGVAAFRAGDLAAVPGYLRAAVALNPNNLAAVYNLGYALHQLGQVAESAPLFLRAVELDPGYGSAYIGLADAIKRGADPAPAVAHFERAIARDEKQPLAHFGLGMALRDSWKAGDRPRAVAAFRRSIELDDTSALAHNYLGYVSNRIDERIQCYRRAIELDPTFAFPHHNLAGCFRQKGDLSGAVTEYRAALKLFPTHTLSLGGLASALAEQEKWDEAADEYRDLCRLLPTSYEGNFGLIYVLTKQGLNVAAVGVFEDLVRRNQSWAYDPRLKLRYNAACAAVLAGTGQGRDAPAADGRTALRRQALEWLRADLTAYRRGFDSGWSRGATDKELDWWLTDPDLTLVRQPMAIGLLPADERAGWTAFWADVRKLRAGPAPPTGK